MTARRTTSRPEDRVDPTLDSRLNAPTLGPPDTDEVREDSSVCVNLSVTDCFISPWSEASRLTTLTSSRYINSRCRSRTSLRLRRHQLTAPPLLALAARGLAGQCQLARPPSRYFYGGRAPQRF